MPAHTYEIILRAEIEIGGNWEADSAAEAVEMAKRELRPHGHIGQVYIDRQILLEGAERSAAPPIEL